MSYLLIPLLMFAALLGGHRLRDAQVQRMETAERLASSEALARLLWGVRAYLEQTPFEAEGEIPLSDLPLPFAWSGVDLSEGFQIYRIQEGCYVALKAPPPGWELAWIARQALANIGGGQVAVTQWGYNRSGRFYPQFNPAVEGVDAAEAGQLAVPRVIPDLTPLVFLRTTP